MTIQVKYGTASQWAAAATVLAVGQPGVESDTGRWKIGDGTTAWAALKFMGNEVAHGRKSGLAAVDASPGTTVAVTFPFTFSAPPSIVLTVATSATASVTARYAYASAITTTGFTLGVVRSGSTASAVDWIAANNPTFGAGT